MEKGIIKKNKEIIEIIKLSGSLKKQNSNKLLEIKSEINGILTYKKINL